MPKPDRRDRLVREFLSSQRQYNEGTPVSKRGPKRRFPRPGAAPVFGRPKKIPKGFRPRGLKPVGGDATLKRL